MKKVTITVMLLLMFFFSMNVQAESQHGVSTWLWNTYEIVNNESEVLAFLQQQQVTDLYLQVDQQIEKSIYQQFIERATELNIKVHALDGAPNWATRNGIKKYKAFKDWLQSYQTSSSPEQRFAGIHLDVEPYLLPEWQKNQQSTIEYYQNFVRDFQLFAQEYDLQFGLDIPFWFDEISYRNKKYGRGTLSEWVINESDYLTIMAYRNFAEGTNGIIQLVKNELDYAEANGKKVIVAVETETSNEGNQISFANYGGHYLEEELLKVVDYYSQMSNFAGVAVHHYDSWRTLVNN